MLVFFNKCEVVNIVRHFLAFVRHVLQFLFNFVVVFVAILHEEVNNIELLLELEGEILELFFVFFIVLFSVIIDVIYHACVAVAVQLGILVVAFNNSLRDGDRLDEGFAFQDVFEGLQQEWHADHAAEIRCEKLSNGSSGQLLDFRSNLAFALSLGS
jgi:hypothetical protein